MSHRSTLVAASTALLLLLTACGAKVIDYQSPGGGAQTLSKGADYQVIPSFADHPNELRALVGSNPSDLWGAEANRLWHFDGSAWSEVKLGAPASTGSLSNIFGQWHIASAGPGKVWIAHKYAVVRVDTTGSTEDFSARIEHGGAPEPSDLSIDSTPAGAAFVVVQGTAVAYAFNGSGFARLPDGAAGRRYSQIRARAADDVWVEGGFPMGLDHFDGTRWVSTIPLGYDHRIIVATSPGSAALFSSTGSVCPGWCHPTAPPYGETTTAPWAGTGVGPGPDGGVDSTALSVPPPSDLDPALAYAGLVTQQAKSGRLALLGCAYPRPADDTIDPYQSFTGHYVVHEWDGAALHARALTNPPPCATSYILQYSANGPKQMRPLLDGTWVLQTPDRPDGTSGEAFLMTP